MRLSDLNNLRKDDRRIKEVTDLGLKYTLMTQYTSFVAVDKIKRADGKLETVKQPLPLPEGVTDAAVGDSKAGLGAMPGAAPRKYRHSSGFLKSEQPAPPPVASPEPETTETIAREKQKDASGVIVDLTVIKIKGAMDKADVDKVLKQRLELFKTCYLKATDLRKNTVKGEITFRLRIGADGRVEKITYKSTFKDAPTILCLKTVFEETRFMPPRHGKVELVVKLKCRRA
jgi:Ca-activated chloride channel family protein